MNRGMGRWILRAGLLLAALVPPVACAATGPVHAGIPAVSDAGSGPVRISRLGTFNEGGKLIIRGTISAAAPTNVPSGHIDVAVVDATGALLGTASKEVRIPRSRVTKPTPAARPFEVRTDVDVAGGKRVLVAFHERTGSGSSSACVDNRAAGRSASLRGE